MTAVFEAILQVLFSAAAVTFMAALETQRRHTKKWSLPKRMSRAAFNRKFEKELEEGRIRIGDVVLSFGFEAAILAWIISFYLMPMATLTTSVNPRLFWGVTGMVACSWIVYQQVPPLGPISRADPAIRKWQRGGILLAVLQLAFYVVTLVAFSVGVSAAV